MNLQHFYGKVGAATRTETVRARIFGQSVLFIKTWRLQAFLSRKSTKSSAPPQVNRPAEAIVRQEEGIHF